MKLIRRDLLRLIGRRLIGAVAAGVCASTAAWTQDYPAHPVTIVVPFTPAGSTDIIARMLAKKLEQRLGKAFLVETGRAPAR